MSASDAKLRGRMKSKLNLKKKTDTVFLLHAEAVCWDIQSELVMKYSKPQLILTTQESSLMFLHVGNDL